MAFTSWNGRSHETAVLLRGLVSIAAEGQALTAVGEPVSLRVEELGATEGRGGIGVAVGVEGLAAGRAGIEVEASAAEELDGFGAVRGGIAAAPALAAGVGWGEAAAGAEPGGSVVVFGVGAVAGVAVGAGRDGPEAAAVAWGELVAGRAGCLAAPVWSRVWSGVGRVLLLVERVDLLEWV
jgi:hypothetical protein